MISYEFWTWGKDNDASNWFSIILTVMAVPGILFLYDKHKRQSIHKLNVSFSPGTTKIGGQDFQALNIQFENQTNQVVYLAGGQFRACSRRFKIPLPPTASGWYPLKFAWSKTVPDQEQYPLEDYECILQTAGPKTNMAATSIAVAKLKQPFFTYQPGAASKVAVVAQIFQDEVHSRGRRQTVLRRNYLLIVAQRNARMILLPPAQNSLGQLYSRHVAACAYPTRQA